MDLKLQAERVEKGMACCQFPFDKCYEGGCPFFSAEKCMAAMREAIKELIHNMQERIKELEAAQTARVMTLEEVIKHYSLPPVVLDDLCWQEDYLQDIEPLYFDFPVEDSFAVHWRGYQSVRKYLEDWKASYGQKWRCWTQRPTDEQRKEAAWDGEQQPEPAE